MKVVLIASSTYGLVNPAIILNVNEPRVVDDEVGEYLLTQTDASGVPIFEKLDDDIASEVLGEAKVTGSKKVVIGKKAATVEADQPSTDPATPPADDADLVQV